MAVRKTLAQSETELATLRVALAQKRLAQIEPMTLLKVEFMDEKSELLTDLVALHTKWANKKNKEYSELFERVINTVTTPKKPA